MGVEYGLYDFSKKEYLHLGKYSVKFGFQVKHEILSKFILEREDIKLISDTGNCAEEDGAWKEVGGWFSEEAES